MDKVKKVGKKIVKHKRICVFSLAMIGVFAGVLAFFIAKPSNAKVIDLLEKGWPTELDGEKYDEPEFVDDENRTNNAFNVADFGDQGNNGWFYRYGSALKPQKSKRLEGFDGEKYYEPGETGLEVKSNFIHTAESSAPILEWRAAEKGDVNIKLTYVKNANKDKNPSYPDGVTIYAYKGQETLGRYAVDIKEDSEEVLEEEISNVSVEELESLYFVVDPNMNNAYDGGSLYVAISDVNATGPSEKKDSKRTDNNASSVDDFGKQGSNGWTYRYGKSVEESELVSTEKDGEYLNTTSPNLQISQGFIHPAINDDAILGWQPYKDGKVELRMKYTKFEQNDGDPSWPDGVTVSVYKNGEKLYSENVPAPSEGEKTVSYRNKKLSVKKSDHLYFVVNANGNSSYDGGSFDISILDRNNAKTEADVAVEELDTRQNYADTKYDFGKQGNNGWYYEECYENEINDVYLMTGFEEDEDRYFDKSYLEIKRDFINPGKGKSAVVKWKVAQDGQIRIDASYTKLKNEDKNPSWPDGTKVSIYHNSTVLTSKEFAPNRNKEVTERLDVESVDVKKGDYITMVVNPKENNAYDGGKYQFSIRGLSPLVGQTENDVAATAGRTNNASAIDDFGAQGNNGWYYQSGYNLNPYNAVNVERMEGNEKYLTSDGIEIKCDYIMPANKGRSANVKWVAAQDGKVNIYADYLKLKNEDKNPSWPDGVTVYLMHNNEVLRTADFEPLVNEEVKKDLSVQGVDVKAGDTLTLMVDGRENTAYDGGKYTFSIEDAEVKTAEMKNDSDSNSASLSADFGEQGENGWYYMEGRSLEQAEILEQKSADGFGYISTKHKDLELKKDYVHPARDSKAIYRWVAAKNGNIDVVGSYTKYGQVDKNPSWPDGVKVVIYKNGEVLYSEDVEAFYGDGNDNEKPFTLSNISVAKGDMISFMIDAKENAAYDGGKLVVDIYDLDKVAPTDPEPEITGRTNKTNLAEAFGEQGNDGWHYLEGRSLDRAELLEKKTEDGLGYVSSKHSGLEMKKDYVHPSKDSKAIYQWTVARDGEIDIYGSYLKFGQMDNNPSWPDGVKLTIYQNDTVLLDQDVSVYYGEGQDHDVPFELQKVAVTKGDRISFVIDAKDKEAYDGGRLAVDIYDLNEEVPEEPVEEPDGRENKTNLADSFGEQGNDGWHYLEGRSLDRAEALEQKTPDGLGYLSAKYDGLEMKKDYVHPSKDAKAIYQWTVAKDGEIDITGSYVKFGQMDNNPSWPDGVKFTIYQNGNVLFDSDVTAYYGDGNDHEIPFALQKVAVTKGDKISFVIDAKDNSAYDGGRLSAEIHEFGAIITPEPQPEPTPELQPERTNNTNLKESFGQQGNDGWYYGMCDWNGAHFELLGFDEDNNRYYNNGKPELKPDFVEPGNGRAAAYKWVAAEDGTIQVKGSYTKFANAADPFANGTCMRIVINGEERKWMGGITQGNFADERVLDFDEVYEVKKGDEIIFLVDCDANDSYDGGRLEVDISSL